MFRRRADGPANQTGPGRLTLSSLTSAGGQMNLLCLSGLQPAVGAALVVAGGPPPPDRSGCGQTASSRTSSVGTSAVGLRQEPSLVVFFFFTFFKISHRQPESHLPPGDASLGETHLRDLHREDERGELHRLHLQAVRVGTRCLASRMAANSLQWSHSSSTEAFCINVPTEHVQ